MTPARAQAMREQLDEMDGDAAARVGPALELLREALDAVDELHRDAAALRAQLIACAPRWS